jgi:5-methylcytosine-specific restriction endonuclease McrBC GTP-binding regulatory subunit McrB
MFSKGQIVFTTFHQSYGYEEFIQGLRPSTRSNNVIFSLEDGIFKRLSHIAMQHPEKDYVLIIDEINRANISKVFGELITLIETDKRWGEENSFSITLPSGESFAVPNNLYIIGTMNSADKSIALIDIALRRRFKFVEVPPKADLIKDTKLQELFVRLNENLKTTLESSDLLVGHAFFIDKHFIDLESIFNENVIPLLYEYYYSDENSVFKAVSNALGINSGFNIIHNTSGKNISRIRVEKK